MSRTDTQLVGESHVSHQGFFVLRSSGQEITGDEHAPGNAVEAIPDGGYGWTVVAACSFLLFWINGYRQVASATHKCPNNNLRRKFVHGMHAVTLFGVGTIATSFTLDHLGGLFCVAGVVLGLCTSLLYTATNSLPVQWFSNKLGMANGIVKAGGGVGATVLPLAAQTLIDRVGLPWTFRILGFMMLITGIPCSLLLRERTRAGQASRFDWSRLKDASFLSLALAGAIGVFALFVPPFFLPLFASSIGLSAATGAGLVAGFGASTAVGRLTGGWICDRIGAFNALAITALINCLSMLAIWPVSSSLPPLFVFSIINGCANGSFFVTLPTAVAALAPGSAAASISLMTSFWTPGYLLGAPVAGILIEITGAADATSIKPYRAAIFYAAGVGVTATLLIVVARFRLNTKLIKKM